LHAKVIQIAKIAQRKCVAEFVDDPIDDGADPIDDDPMMPRKP
jgi:hypothetical protein